MLLCKFGNRALSLSRTDGRHCFLKLGSFLRNHHIGRLGLLEDGLRYLHSLIEIRLDELLGKLLPVGGLKDELLEGLIVVVLNGLAALCSPFG